MKPFRLALLLASLAAVGPWAGVTCAQGTNAVHSRDGLDVWAVGDSGRYYRSFDGGVAWSFANLGSRPLRGVVTRGFRVVIVGDSGRIWRSENSGGTWTFTAAAGIPALRAVEMPTDSIGYAVGDGGVILKTVDAGASWTPQSSGTSARLHAVRFTSSLVGWVAGAGGFVAKTTNGGGLWAPQSVGTTQDLFAIDVRGSTLWIVGAAATALRSLDGGVQWAPMPLRIDSKSDVKAVWVQSPDSVVLAGGGGFIRRSFDGGATWSFPPHSMHGQISDLWYTGMTGFAVSNRNRVVMRTNDFGASWVLPTGATLKRAWVSKFLPAPVSVRGSTIVINPQNRNTLFCMLNAQVYRSTDEGDTWTAQGNAVAGGMQTNAFVVSPRDSNVFLAAVVTTASPTDKVWKSEDGGVTWVDKLTKAFGEYGIPLEINPDKPDTVYFGGDSDKLQRSTDFGSTWAPWGNQVFRTPCDLVSVPDSTNLMIVADGETGVGQGQILRSTDEGANFSVRWTNPNTTGGSEVPGLSTSRLRNSTTFATAWSNGGVQRSTDYGTGWTNVSGATTTWGTDIAKDDPNVVMFGRYSGGRSHLSLDGGLTFANADTNHLPNANYSFYLRDRGLFLAEQSNGIWKMNFLYTIPVSNTQSVAVVSPNGGESWAAGSSHAISWSATNLPMVRIEYRRSPSQPWQTLADVAGNPGSWTWTVPQQPTTQAEVRISDALDASPSDLSNATFSITQPAIAVSPPALAFGPIAIGGAATQVLTLTNSGGAPLTVSSVVSGHSAFTPHRTSLSIAAGSSDTLGVTFRPVAATPYSASLTLTSNAPTSPTVVAMSGSGTDTLYLSLLSPNGGEVWQYGTVHPITWSSAIVDSVAIELQTTVFGPWSPIAPSVPASTGSWNWTIPDLPTTLARIRVRHKAGTAVDSSNGAFSVTVPRWSASPDPIDFGTTPVGMTNTTTLHLQNIGTAALTISSITTGNSDFHPGRSSLVLGPGASDTLGISYRPSSVAVDTAFFSFTSDDPLAPHSIRVTGMGTADTDSDHSVPRAFVLGQNTPNPFARSTSIHYALPVEAFVTLDVFDLHGHRVATLVQGIQPPGQYSVPFGSSGLDRERLGSGVYFYRFRAGGYSVTRKMLRLR